MATELHLRYEGVHAYVLRLVAELEAAGATVRWDPPPYPLGDEAGHGHVDVELRVRGDEGAVRRVISHFREFYPAGRIVLRVAAS